MAGDLMAARLMIKFAPLNPAMPFSAPIPLTPITFTQEVLRVYNCWVELNKQIQQDPNKFTANQRASVALLRTCLTELLEAERAKRQSGTINDTVKAFSQLQIENHLEAEHKQRLGGTINETTHLFSQLQVNNS